VRGAAFPRPDVTRSGILRVKISDPNFLPEKPPVKKG